jgi:hypothetical protein
MITYRTLSLLLLLTMNIVGNKQCSKSSDTAIIVWSEKIKLNLADFQNTTRYWPVGVQAVSVVNLKLYYKIDKGNLKKFDVKCLFIKKESGRKVSADEYILNHEQSHFDLGEVYARKFRKEIISIGRTINGSNYLMLDSLYNHFREMLNQQQEIYDNETKHSQDSIMQLKWDLRIKAQLDSLKQFSVTEYKFN